MLWLIFSGVWFLCVLCFLVGDLYGRHAASAEWNAVVDTAAMKYENVAESYLFRWDVLHYRHHGHVEEPHE